MPSELGEGPLLRAPLQIMVFEVTVVFINILIVHFFLDILVISRRSHIKGIDY